MAPVTLAKRVIGGSVRTAGTVLPFRSQGRQTYEDTLQTLSEASVDRCFNAFRDVPWDDPAYALVEDDQRWILPSVDPLGAHQWYQSLPRERQIEVGKHRFALVTKIGSQFEQLLLQGGSAFLLPTATPSSATSCTSSPRRPTTSRCSRSSPTGSARR
jgi:hypothetical protein